MKAALLLLPSLLQLSAPAPKKVEVEFLEVTKGQLYLPYISFKDRFVLDLYSFDRQMATSDLQKDPLNETDCPQKIFTNYNLKSLYSPIPKPPNILECPSMKQTCCTTEAFNQLASIWRVRYSKYIEMVQSYYRYYVIAMMRFHPKVREMAEEMKDIAKDKRCYNAAEYLSSLTIAKEEIDRVNEMMKRTFEFDRYLKKGFVCLLCDYDNLRFVDPVSRTVGLNKNVCESIAKNTIDFYSHANKFIYRYLNTISLFLSCIPPEGYPELYGVVYLPEDSKVEFLRVDNSESTANCRVAVEKGLNVFVNCLHYCSTYDLWYLRDPLYRSIEQLGRLVELVKRKITRDVSQYRIDKPQSVKNFLPILSSKSQKWDLFRGFNFIFATESGAKVDGLVYEVEAPF